MWEQHRAAKASHPSPVSRGNPGPGRQGHLPPSAAWNQSSESCSHTPQALGLLEEVRPQEGPTGHLRAEARTALQGTLRKERGVRREIISQHLPPKAPVQLCLLLPHLRPASSTTLSPISEGSAP